MIFFKQNIKSRKPIKNNKGAAVVEFALALVFLMIFLMAFMQIAGIFIAHEKLYFATSVASRYFSIHDEEAATIMYTQIEPDAAFSFDLKNVNLDKRIDVPLDFYNMFQKGGTKWPLHGSVRTFVEPYHSGDN